MFFFCFVFFGIVSFFHMLKMIVEVAFLQHFRIGRCSVSEINAIEVSFRRKNSRQNRDTVLELTCLRSI